MAEQEKKQNELQCNVSLFIDHHIIDILIKFALFSGIWVAALTAMVMYFLLSRQ